MRARIWRDPETLRWCYDVRYPGLRATGDRATWEGALREAYEEMAWITSHSPSWPAS